MTTELVGHLVSVFDGNVNALGPLADWCDEHHMSDRAASLRWRLDLAAARLAGLAEDMAKVNGMTLDQSFRPTGSRKLLDKQDAQVYIRDATWLTIQKCQTVARRMFPDEYAQARKLAEDRDRQKNIQNVEANLKRIFGDR
jgi:hypothetical protein